jgi:phosphodiesterase/alkaline phosphatase D-like protein
MHGYYSARTQLFPRERNNNKTKAARVMRPAAPALRLPLGDQIYCEQPLQRAVRINSRRCENLREADQRYFSSM